jgi:chemotaxis response regulator CheB
MRIGIVNDVPLACEALKRALAQRPGFHVAWTAKNGAEAVAACAQDRPDLVLMDLIMPVMDGVEATRRIMAATPCPILVVTSNVGANAGRVYDAMGHGALDAVDTPVAPAGGKQINAAPLLAKIEIVSRLIAEPSANHARGSLALRAPAAKRGPHLVGLGASAGGPAAIATVLGALPRDFGAAIVVVQHVDLEFAAGMADWLNGASPLPVRLAREGDVPESGKVLLAGTNDHLELGSAGVLTYTAEPRAYVYRPSVDVFFESVVRYWPGAVTGVLLTGMGRDGALGLKALRNAGHYTIAQDQATSAVYGMPKAAARLDAAVEILPLSAIAPAITRQVAANGRRP